MTGQMTLIFVGVFAFTTQVLADGQSLFTAHAGGMGCAVERLGNSRHPQYQVRGVSRDGARLSYTEEVEPGDGQDPVRSVFLLDLQSGENFRLGETVTNSGAFSPDGRFLVTAYAAEGQYTDIYEIDLETRRPSALTEHEQWDWLPAYSPDGSTIVFNSYRVDGQSEIFLYDRESRALKQMTDDPRYDAHGEFSPDGRRILFHRMVVEREEGGYDFELFVIDLASGQEKQVSAGTPFEESYASWAPDGKHLVFSSDQDGHPEKLNLYILGPDGEIHSRLTKGDWKDSYAFWTRDGKYVYFNSDRDGSTKIYRIPMDGLACVKDSR